MRHLRLCQSVILFAMYAAASSVHAQQSSIPNHSRDVFMNSSEAKEMAAKLIGRCGDAETQDVMNACFALEFKKADEEMVSTYRTIMKGLEHQDQEQVRTAQRAWIRYREFHCRALGSLQAGGGSLEPTEVFSCKAELTRARTKEIHDGYKTPR